MTNITTTEYETFQQAYSFFNDQLFDGTLPAVLITLQRKPKTHGYFAPDSFISRDDREGEIIHELAMNPDSFGRDDKTILATLAHEMCHVWQREHGKQPRRAYHDRQWAAKMIEIGLQPTDTGEPGGKQTGQSVTHFVIEGGAFDQVTDKLLSTGFVLRWQSRTGDQETAAKKRASKTKYVCPNCDANAWAKPESKLICGECYMAGNYAKSEGGIFLMMPVE